MQTELKARPVEGVDFGWTLFDREANPNEIVVSASGIMLLMKSPRHYAHRYIKGNKKKATAAMEDGKMLHMAILEKARFDEKYLYIDKAALDGTLDGSADYKAHIEKINTERGLKLKKSGTNGELIALIKSVDTEARFTDEVIAELSKGKIVIDDKDMALVRDVLEAVAENEDVSFLLNHATGKMEQPFWYRHPRTGVIIHGVLDWFSPQFSGRPIFADAKTCRSAEYSEFQKKIWNELSFIQMAMYFDAIAYIYGVDPIGLYLAVEKGGEGSPSIVEGYPCDFGMLEQGRAVYNKKLEVLMECKQANKWPSYSGGRFRQISLPYFADRKLDEYAEAELEQVDA